jgi:outer membrane PBP1 activator LpoA protein
MRSAVFPYFLSAMLLLSACAPQNTMQDYSSLSALQISSPYHPDTVHTLLTEAQQNPDPIASNDQRLIALNLLTNPAHLAEATNLRNELARRELTAEQTNTLQLITAKQYLLAHQVGEAIRILKRNPRPTDTPYNPTLRNWLLSQAYLANQSVAPFIHSALAASNSDASTTQRQIIDALQTFEPSILAKAEAESPDEPVQAYVKAARLVQNHALTPVAFAAQSAQLHSAYPQWISRSTSATQNPQNIAILLPLQGPLADSAQSILQGVLATYYTEHAGNTEAPRLYIEDTSMNGFEATLAATLAKRPIDYVIGPLEKSAVQALTPPPESTTIVALNKPDNLQTGVKYLYLSPHEETQAIADKLHHRGYHHALVITTDDRWQQKIAEVFTESWQAQGGTIEQTTLDQSRSFSASLKHAFSIDKSEARAQDLAKLINENFKFIPVRRHDIDMIFLAANPADARQIKPLLKYYFAGDIPVYAISTLYQTNATSYQDKDLNDITFMDSSWYTNQQDKAIKQSLQQIWGHQFLQQKRLYALGHDAYEIIMHSEKNRALPHTLQGATGHLDTESQTIQRTLDWLRFSKGIPTRVSL